ERLRLGAAGAVEIGRGLLDQVHALSKQRAECGGIGEPLVELNKSAIAQQTVRHGERLLRDCYGSGLRRRYDEQIIARELSRVQQQDLLWFPRHGVRVICTAGTQSASPDNHGKRQKKSRP